jgi:hypothetical protein
MIYTLRDWPISLRRNHLVLLFRSLSFIFTSPSVGSPEIYPLFQPPQVAHRFAAENLPALDET